jgi:hypothetical protein
VSFILIGLGVVANSRVSLVGMRAMRAVPTVHEQMAQNHQTEEAIGKDRAYRHFDHEYGD